MRSGAFAVVRQEAASAATVEWIRQPERRMNRIMILGAGAVGGTLAGHVARAGRDVRAMDTWFQHINASLHRLIQLALAIVLIIAAKLIDWHDRYNRA